MADAAGGRVKISGAKNAVLPIIAATLLGQDTPSLLDEVPALEDVHTITEVLRKLGVRADFDAEKHQLFVDSTVIGSCEAPYDLVRKMRASFLIMGPLLARCGQAKISLPGGCAIGTRPIDLHLKGFEALGAEIKIGHGFIEAAAPEGLKGAKIYLDFPSVGATENIIMALRWRRARPSSRIRLRNRRSSISPITSMSWGQGSGEPVRMSSRSRACRSSRAAITQSSRIALRRGRTWCCRDDARRCLHRECISEHLKPVIAKLKEAGVTIEEDVDGIRVTCDHRTKSVDIKTMPYPGFPTDMQAQFMAMMAISEGTGVVTETVFENRFMHVDELKRMGANIKIDGRTSIVEGVEKLYGCQVKATDLRAGAAMVLAGLVAEGETQVGYIHHIDRGYDNLVAKLVGLGADICRVDK